MSKEKRLIPDLKLWKRFIKSVTPIGKALPSTNQPKIVNFHQESQQISNKKPKSKKNVVQRYQARLDLHGMTKNEAYQYLEVQLSIQKLRGSKCVLVITGKGHGKGDGLGILKRKVPLWMENAKFKKLVKNWAPALPKDGGEGAIYVYLTNS